MSDVGLRRSFMQALVFFILYERAHLNSSNSEAKATKTDVIYHRRIDRHTCSARDLFIGRGIV